MDYVLPERSACLSRNKRTAVSRSAACQVRPYAAPAAVDKFPIAAAPAPFCRFAHRLALDGNARLQDPYSTPAPARTEARQERLSSALNTSFPTAGVLRESWNPGRCSSSATFRSAENPRSHPGRGVLSIDSSHNNKELERFAAAVRQTGESAAGLHLLVRGNCRKP